MSDEASHPEPLNDPLTLFVKAHHEARQAKPNTKRFNGGEHAWLGGRGAALACERQKDLDVSPERLQFIPRRDGKETLSYGELVALSGDLYRSPDELFNETPSFLPSPWRNDLPAIREMFGQELRWIEARAKETASQDQAPYPEHNLALAWSAKNYLELALDNTDHFGWHNMLAYCLHHQNALTLAASADVNADENDATLREALYTNAFADHFLTDGFAAGHIRVPRAEIRQWAAKQGFNEKIAGSLSKLLHDQDGHIDARSVHGVADENARRDDDGLAVVNAAGASWYTRCDGQLFTGGEPLKSPRIAQPIEAVVASVTELLRAWKLRELPGDTYAATHFVPFPSPTAPSLVSKFPADMPDAQVNALWDGMGWYSKIYKIGVEPTHIRALFQALPDIMSSFRANVGRDINRDQRRVRIAPAYLAGFSQIA